MHHKQISFEGRWMRLWVSLLVLALSVGTVMGKTSRKQGDNHNEADNNVISKRMGLLSSLANLGAEGDPLYDISRKSFLEKKQGIPGISGSNSGLSPNISSTTTTIRESSPVAPPASIESASLSENLLLSSVVDTPLSTVTPATKEESALLFYMYDLHEKFWWRWPQNGTERECQENGYLSHAHAEFSAIGRPIIPEDGLFLTWHFSMFNSLFNRFKRSPRRTKDPAKASMFVIPYDIGLDGYLNPHNCGNRRQCTGGLLGNLMDELNAMPYFTRHQGADHVVLWSLGQYHPWPRAGCDVFMRSTCERCTFSCYWMDPTRAENKFVAMPFPAAYHYWDGIQRLPWDSSRAEERNLTAVYLGSTLTLNPWHTKIRRAMAAQCNSTTDCHWLKIAHSSIDNTIGDLLSVYKKAVFCLCPPGDDPARKAVFDAIVSGCIPVIFEVAPLYNQYPWHIGEDAALDISVYIPGGAMRAGKIQFMDVLRNISPDIIRKKQWALSQVAPRIQYSIPPYQLLTDKFDETVWVPPFHDAAELALDGFFQRTQRMLHNQSTNIPHRLRTGREWGADYDVVRVQVPGEIMFFGEEINALPLGERAQYKEAYYAQHGIRHRNHTADILDNVAGRSTENVQGEGAGPGRKHHGRHGGGHGNHHGKRGPGAGRGPIGHPTLDTER
jgi:hypothetical protein